MIADPGEPHVLKECRADICDNLIAAVVRAVENNKVIDAIQSAIEVPCSRPGVSFEARPERMIPLDSTSNRNLVGIPVMDLNLAREVA